MNIALTRTLLLAIAVAATGATLATVLSAPSVQGPALAVVPPTPAGADEAIVMLPTVQVVPESEPTLLATVMVRADALPDVDDADGFAGSIDYSAGAAGGGTGMPYYSFGKSMHRAYWE